MVYAKQAWIGLLHTLQIEQRKLLSVVCCQIAALQNVEFPRFYSWSASIIVCMNVFPSCNLYSKVQMYADDSSFNVAHSDEYILEKEGTMIYMK